MDFFLEDQPRSQQAQSEDYLWRHWAIKKVVERPLVESEFSMH